MSNNPPQDGALSRPGPIPIPGRTPSTNPSRLSALNNRRGNVGSTPIPPSLQAKMAALASRAPSSSPVSVDAATAALKNAGLSDRPLPSPGPSLRAPASAPVPGRPGPPTLGGLAARRMGKNVPKLSGMDLGLQNAGLGSGRPNQEDEPPRRNQGTFSTPFSNFGKIVDPSGALNFSGKAVLHAQGVDFSNGSSFAINMDQLQLDEELGKGNYGTVKKVFHKPTKVAMAMKEIRLELDEAKLNGIIMELDILHRAVAPEIVEFYGAFFIESCVYYCMEYMDAGSLDKLQGDGVPEHVLARITGSMVRGLKFLKDDLQIIHRDVKPTNVLMNRKGQVKLCDFGVSGQLEKSLAKTNIGCQSYMAPERIRGESQNNLGTYTVSSDVWSLGLSMIEMALGHYPYPPETYANVFAQLTAIVDGDPPELPEHFSDISKDFVARCLHKVPERRATYAELLEHPFLVEDSKREVDMPGWVAKAIEAREARLREQQQQQQAQHAAQNGST
ncbi:kinase-like protein [Trametes coccinea BRFM310]|uniref:mitogen-activated protein kinase kinase n=1 Tax=Trametes coccinea (strain BRFM310) TaxID=1353009 RepID=A0A1Y2ISI9_TRAC3|nr:kinase-like protein [Trametes coccinea BRFM310]